MEELIHNHPSVIRSILVTFIFQGTYLVMGIYMFLLYWQGRKKDYLLYSLYLLLFAGYYFIRIDQALLPGFILPAEGVLLYFITPLLFLITAIYINFIDTFAEIGSHSKRFSRELSIFSKVLYGMAAVSVGYLLITRNLEAARTYLSPAMTAVYVYAIYAVIRAFIVIKSELRYYVLASNIFLIGFTALGLYTAADTGFNEGVYSNTLWGFYSINASQFGIFLEMICFALGLGYKFNQIELEKEKIQKMDALKTQLYTNISHEIRTPLTLITGPVENQLSKPDLQPEDRLDLMLVKNNAERLLKLVDQMLDLSILDSGRRVLRVSRGNMAVVLKQLVDAFRYQAGVKNIYIDARISGLHDVWFDMDVMEKVGANLLSNAVKYALEDSIIVMEASKIAGDAVLSVTNTTNQARVDDLNRLFQRFYQEDEAAPGVGVGLALVKELVELAKGRVEIQAKGGQRICFTVAFPAGPNSFEITAHSDKTGRGTDDQDAASGTDVQDRSTVLVVEDDPEIREFTASLFRDEYHVATAADGRTGLERAIEILPDVIITDIMMPEMDGTELCRALKTNVMTSHIPVLMLTARAGEAHELEGYETGANTYLTKPFHPGILKLKVRNLLSDRHRFRQSYLETFSINPQMALPPAESNFLSTLQQVCEAHIADTELTAEKLAALMNMSRTQLHRKLHAVFKTSTTSFIRAQRIKLACGLIADNNAGTMAEIAYQVGFGTVSYFNKCFKEQMGCAPNEYLRNKAKTGKNGVSQHMN